MPHNYSFLFLADGPGADRMGNVSQWRVKARRSLAQEELNSAENKAIASFGPRHDGCTFITPAPDSESGCAAPETKERGKNND